MKNSTRALLVFVGLISSLAAFAVPQIAVLDTVLAAGVDPAAGVLVTSKIEEEFVNQRNYVVLDRANIERVLREKEFQLSSGIVKNEEIRQAGEYLGADYVVVATVSRIGQTYVISAKMIDVATGEIAAQASAERSGKIDLLLEIAREVGARLAGTAVGGKVEPAAAPPPAKEKPPKEPKLEPAPKPVKEKKPLAPFTPSRFVAGVRAGANFASVSEDNWIFVYTFDAYLYPDWTPYSKFGLNAGGFIEINVAKMLAVGVEILFTQKGYRFDFTDYDSLYNDLGITTNVWTFNYLEIPFYMKLRLPARVSPYLSLGASVSMLLSGSVENQYETQWALDTHNAESMYSNPANLSDLPWSFNRLDMGLLLGAGVDILLRRLILNLDVRYTLGLLNISSDLSPAMKNGVLTVTTGLGFHR